MSEVRVTTTDMLLEVSQEDPDVVELHPVEAPIQVVEVLVGATHFSVSMKARLDVLEAQVAVLQAQVAALQAGT